MRDTRIDDIARLAGVEETEEGEGGVGGMINKKKIAFSSMRIKPSNLINYRIVIKLSCTNHFFFSKFNFTRSNSTVPYLIRMSPHHPGPHMADVGALYRHKDAFM